MPEIITAVYENGVLRPLSPLLLQEHQTVQIQVLVSSHPPSEEMVPFSKQERQELAKRMGQRPGLPLSEIIIEDRGEL